jgi:hypothetical protein
LFSLPVSANERIVDYKRLVSSSRHCQSGAVHVFCHKETMVFKPEGSYKKTFQTGSSIEFRISYMMLHNRKVLHSTEFIKAGISKNCHEEIFQRFTPIHTHYGHSLAILKASDLSPFSSIQGFCLKNFPSKVKHFKELFKKDLGFIARAFTPERGYFKDYVLNRIEFEILPPYPLGMTEDSKLDLGFDLDETLQG